MSADRKSLIEDEGGAAMLEFTAAVFTFFIMLFGVIEFANVFFQWNAATKAVQLGARLAVVSDPVAEELAEIDGLGDRLPGQPYAGTYDVVCNGADASCSCDGDECPNAMTFSQTALDTIVFGRGNQSCAPVTPGALNRGMCHLFIGLEPENVEVRYQYTGLGYAGRPGGPVPTVTVSLVGMTYNFLLIGSFLPASAINMPGFATTVSGEDLNDPGAPA